MRGICSLTSLTCHVLGLYGTKRGNKDRVSVCVRERESVREREGERERGKAQAYASTRECLSEDNALGGD